MRSASCGLRSTAQELELRGTATPMKPCCANPPDLLVADEGDHLKQFSGRSVHRRVDLRVAALARRSARRRPVSGANPATSLERRSSWPRVPRTWSLGLNFQLTAAPGRRSTACPVILTVSVLAVDHPLTLASRTSTDSSRGTHRPVPSPLDPGANDAYRHSA
jgi:hypothetical protein